MTKWVPAEFPEDICPFCKKPIEFLVEEDSEGTEYTVVERCPHCRWRTDFGETGEEPHTYRY